MADINKKSRLKCLKCPECDTIHLKRGLTYCTIDGADLIETDLILDNTSSSPEPVSPPIHNNHEQNHAQNGETSMAVDAAVEPIASVASHDRQSQPPPPPPPITESQRVVLEVIEDCVDKAWADLNAEDLHRLIDPEFEADMDDDNEMNPLEISLDERLNISQQTAEQVTVDLDVIRRNSNLHMKLETTHNRLEKKILGNENILKFLKFV
jgi:hypothetical protein